MVKEENQFLFNIGDLIRNKYGKKKYIGMILKIKQENNFYTYEVYDFKFNDSYYYSKVELEKI